MMFDRPLLYGSINLPQIIDARTDLVWVHNAAGYKRGGQETKD